MSAEARAGAAREPMLARLAGTVAQLSGWRHHAAAAFCGALATAAMPPLYLVPLLLPAFTGLIWLLDSARRPRQAALIAWSFGFGHMLTGLYWVGIAFLVDAERYAAFMPIAVVGMATGMALFPALVGLGAGWLRCRGPARVALFAALWLAVEWVRSWVLTGFPWNLVGNVWAFSPPMLQLAAVTGVWGLSLVTVLAAAAPAALADPGAATRSRHPRRRYAFVAAMLILPGIVWLGGALRLANAPPPGAEVVDGVHLRLVQASIDQSLKWQPDQKMGHVEQQMRLTLGEGFQRVTHVIWPETAVPYLLGREAQLRRFIGRAVPPGGVLLTGAPRGPRPGEARGIWNSLFALNGRGNVVGTYDKHHLVPFGEYVPLRGLLGLDKLTPGTTDFNAGPGLATLALPGLPPVSPLICYEAIFPGRVADADAQPTWLLNVTNDAWFGTSSGPYQHFASARIRAVEEGLPLIRAANTGISAVFDGYGRVLGRLGLNEIGVLDTPLPRPVPGLTWYASVTPWIVHLLYLVVALSTFVLRRYVP